ncbi:hypothetical protein E3N88_05467 [Mikania micrantha]|uniref:Uncharacterized protein n=1 Tax=Mikania micrantha TaxID=192012 RepID=A0A5N6PLV1_9ASTR|nr:hypothetical protein E3N88_05467 [Mikania micrantha]
MIGAPPKSLAYCQGLVSSSWRKQQNQEDMSARSHFKNTLREKMNAHIVESVGELDKFLNEKAEENDIKLEDVESFFEQHAKVLHSILCILLFFLDLLPAMFLDLLSSMMVVAMIADNEIFLLKDLGEIFFLQLQVNS